MDKLIQRNQHDGGILVPGRTPVLEALKSDSALMIYAREGLKGISDLLKMAKEAQVPIQYMSKDELDIMFPNNQGILALSRYAYADLDDVLHTPSPFFLILDHVQDSYNLGAILRSALAFGVDAVIVPNRRAAALTPAAAKASAGAFAHIPIVQVANISQTIQKLQSNNIWVFCAALEGRPIASVDFKGSLAIVIGNEHEGASRLVKEKSDYLISIPTQGPLSSLNASVAAGIVLYEAHRQRQA